MNLSVSSPVICANELNFASFLTVLTYCLPEGNFALKPAHP